MALFAKLLGALYAFGLVGDGSTFARICGMACVVLAQLGYTVNRAMVKSAASTAAMLVFLMFGMHTMTGCGSSLSGSGFKQDTLNCAGPSMKQAIGDFGPAFETALISQVQGDGTLMKSGVEGLLGGLITDEAKCVGLNSLAKLLTPANPTSGVASSPLNVSHDDIAAELANMKTKLAPGRDIVLPAEQAQ